jgi:hypothetical protein
MDNCKHCGFPHDVELSCTSAEQRRINRQAHDEANAGKLAREAVLAHIERIAARVEALEKRFDDHEDMDIEPTELLAKISDHVESSDVALGHIASALFDLVKLNVSR